jgi:PAS domain S-box-containing protein
MAWVGFAEHDAAKSIRPVAWAGVDSGYIANAQYSWADDAQRGPGFAGKAIRSGETVYVRNFATDPQTVQGRESTMQYGYRSGIALPLKDASANAFGVLLIYSTGIDAISPDEKRLLEELAGDLAFGVVALRTRVAHKRAEEALKESNAKYRRIVETSSEGIWLIDHDIKTVFVNAHMAEMLGYSSEEMLGRLFTDFIFEDDIPDHEQRIKHRRRGMAESYERRFRCKDGRILWTQASATPILDVEHRYMGSFAMFADITERKRAEEILRRRNEELERFEKLVVGRELRMVELKSRITQLEEALASGKEKDRES